MPNERRGKSRHAAELLRQFLISDGVAELDGDGVKALYGNRAATEFFPREIAAPTETAGKVWLEHYRRSLVTGASVRFEYEHPGVRGSRWLSVAVNYLENGPDRKRRFSFVGEDITEKRTADDRLRHTNEELRRPTRIWNSSLSRPATICRNRCAR